MTLPKYVLASRVLSFARVIYERVHAASRAYGAGACVTWRTVSCPWWWLSASR